MRKSVLTNIYGEGCSYETVNDVEIVKSFTNESDEYDAIRNNVGIFDFSNYGIIKVTGEDARDFLQNVTTRDFEYLPPEKARTAFMLNEEGNVVSLVHVFNMETYYYILTDPQHADITLEWLSQHADGDVKVESMAGKDVVIGIEGPKSWEIAKEYLPFEISAFAFMNVTEITVEDEKVVMSRFGFTGEYGYIFIAPEKTGRILWDGIMKLGNEKGIKPCGNDALATCMLEVRQPDINVEVIDGISVFESRLQWLIDFTKEDYIGYEAVSSKMEEPTQYGIIGFVTEEGKTLEAEDKVFVENEEIGKVLCCFESTKLNKNLGLVLIKNEFAAVGLELTIKNAGEELIEMQTVSNPYIIPESWLIKMV